jgi:hypothetical protein
VVVLVAAVVVPSVALAAGGTFTDDDTSIFEADIEWLADAGVTRGCNPPDNTLFCPNQDVTRGQMAAFMRRFAQFLGAEDGIVDQADHATTADSATIADHAATAANATTADNADELDGRNWSDFQPTLFAFDHEVSYSVVGPVSDWPDVVEATVSTSGGPGGIFFCKTGFVPKAFILVTATGYTSGLTDGETATVVLAHNGTYDGDTWSVVEDSDGSFAVQHLYVTNGGNETFSLQVQELTPGQAYSLFDPAITVEVLQDTYCAPGMIGP